MEFTKKQKEQIFNAIKETPGKADDVLESAACFSERLSQTLRYVKDNYVEEDGTLQDIKLGEVDKWLPILRYLLGQVQDIAQECFGVRLVDKVENDVIRLILNWLGLTVGNE